MEKKITMDEFIKRFNKMQTYDQKKKCIKSFIRQEYCPVSEKYGILKVMVDKSISTQPNGLKYIDMFVYKVNLAMAIVLMYTNISSGEKTAMEYYDFIVQNRVVETIKEATAFGEMDELASISSSIIATFDNENSLMSSISHIFETYTTLSAKIISDNAVKLADVLSDKNKIDDIFVKFKSVLRE